MTRAVPPFLGRRRIDLCANAATAGWNGRGRPRRAGRPIGGRLTNRRVWAEFGPLPADRRVDRALAALQVAGDGACLDADGGLWIADAIGDRLIRVVEGGTITDEIKPGSPVYACALGGTTGRTLFACAAPDFHEEPRKSAREARMLAIQVAIPAA